MFSSSRSCHILLIAVGIFHFSDDVQAQSQANNNLLGILTKGFTPNKAYLVTDISQDLQKPISDTCEDFVPETDIRMIGNSNQTNGRSIQCNHTTNYSPPDIPLVKLGKKWYYFQMFFKGNYFKANQYCNYHGLHLLTIDTKEENYELIAYLRNTYPNQKFWTSGTDMAEEGHYIWLSTGKPMTYTNWAENQPDNAGKVEHCLALSSFDANSEHKWNDINCAQNWFFICEQIVISTP